jgi:RNA polymerase sigma factor (TIGR02999 family)
VLQSGPLRERHDPKLVDRHELDDLFSLTYEELRRLASRVKGDHKASLSPTALVNEAWLKLAGSPVLRSASQLHFKRIAACAMRQVLVDAARRRNAEKRGGAEAPLVTLDEAVDQIAATSREVLALDAALNDLATINPRQAAMVECRYFSGLDVSETASLLGVSEATVLRDWRAAKAWLAAQVVQSRSR